MADLTQFINLVRQKTSLVDVVGKEVRLQRKSQGAFVGLCPFHTEKTPSFRVNEAKGYYHCFGCGAHGDVFSFLMDKSGLSFMMALETLAAQAGLSLPKPSKNDDESFSKSKKLYEVCQFAADWFEGNLKSSLGEKARLYLEKRGLSKSTQETFKMGFAPAQGPSLTEFLIKKGFEEGVIIQAGLAILPPERDNPYDRFKGRIIFPISDAQGKIVAFGGRILGDGQPKYLNSPETPIFHKGQIIYGLDKATKLAKKETPWIVVEGYLDVILLHQNGYMGAVAAMGTAVGEFQLEQLWRRSTLITFCFDGDEAGKNAAEKTVQRALPLIEPQKRIQILHLSGGEDPASLMESGRQKFFEGLLASPISLLDFIWSRGLEKINPDQSPESKALLKKYLLDTCETIKHGDLKTFYRQSLLEKFRGLVDFKNQPSTAFKKAISGVKKVTSVISPPKKVEQSQKILLACLINHPTLIPEKGDHLLSLAWVTSGMARLADALLSLSGEENSSFIREQLEKQGFNEILLALKDKSILSHAPFINSSDIEEARMGYDFLEKLLGGEDFKKEKKDSVKTLKESFDEKNWQILKNLKEQEYNS
jgi:DNA primase